MSNPRVLGLNLDPATLGFTGSEPGHTIAACDFVKYQNQSQSVYSNQVQLQCSCGGKFTFSLRDERTKADARGLRHWKEHLLGVAADPSEKLRMGAIHTPRTIKTISVMPLTHSQITSFATTSRAQIWLSSSRERLRLNFGVVVETTQIKSKKTTRALVSCHGTREEAIGKARAALSKSQLTGDNTVEIVEFGDRVSAPTRLSVFSEAIERADDARGIAQIQEALDDIKELLAASRLLESKRDELVERLQSTLMRPMDRVS